MEQQNDITYLDFPVDELSDLYWETLSGIENTLEVSIAKDTENYYFRMNGKVSSFPMFQTSPFYVEQLMPVVVDIENKRYCLANVVMRHYKKEEYMSLKEKTTNTDMLTVAFLNGLPFDCRLENLRWVLVNKHPPSITEERENIVSTPSVHRVLPLEYVHRIRSINYHVCIAKDDANYYFSDKNNLYIYPMLEQGEDYVQVEIPALGKRIFLHRIVMEHYRMNEYMECLEHEKLGNNPQVNHINYHRADNRLENLEWMTVQQNQANKQGYGGNKFDLLSSLPPNCVPAICGKKEIPDFYFCKDDCMIYQKREHDYRRFKWDLKNTCTAKGHTFSRNVQLKYYSILEYCCLLKVLLFSM